jgi:hypothetical protein
MTPERYPNQPITAPITTRDKPPKNHRPKVGRRWASLIDHLPLSAPAKRIASAASAEAMPTAMHEKPSAVNAPGGYEIPAGPAFGTDAW